jgi:hypothetical protein
VWCQNQRSHRRLGSRRCSSELQKSSTTSRTPCSSELRSRLLRFMTTVPIQILQMTVLPTILMILVAMVSRVRHILTPCGRGRGYTGLLVHRRRQARHGRRSLSMAWSAALGQQLLRPNPHSGAKRSQPQGGGQGAHAPTCRLLTSPTRPRRCPVTSGSGGTNGNKAREEPNVSAGQASSFPAVDPAMLNLSRSPAQGLASLTCFSPPLLEESRSDRACALAGLSR